MPSRLVVRAVLCGLLLLFSHYTAVSANAPRTIQLTILHTNDTHGHLRPFSYPDTFDSTSPLARLKARRDIGGAARRSTLVKQIRQEKGRETLLIDAGDICDGTPFSTEYQGDADIAAMNAIGYDLACPGNHEFNNTLPQVRKMIADAQFPLVCANVTVKADGKPLYAPYVVKEIGTAKVAFFGLLTYSARTYPAARNDLVVEPPIEAARRLVPELRKRADLVVAVTHIGVEEDRQLATAVDGIDVIVGGHSHTLLPAPLFIGSVPSTHPHSVNGTVIVQNHQWGGTLGRLDLTLRRSEEGAWAVQKYSGRLLPITSSVPEDPAVAAVVERYWKPIAPKYEERLGEAADDFAKRGPDYAEYHFVADALRERMGTEFHLENMGGVRAPLIKGPITYGDLVRLDPFSNTIVTFKATGRQIKEMLVRFRPAVSGLRYVLDDGRLTETTLNGQPLEDDRVYFGSTNSFFAQTVLEGIPEKTDTKRARLEALRDYLRAHKVIRPAYDGRRILKNIDRWG